MNDPNGEQGVYTASGKGTKKEPTIITVHAVYIMDKTLGENERKFLQGGVNLINKQKSGTLYDEQTKQYYQIQFAVTAVERPQDVRVSEEDVLKKYTIEYELNGVKYPAGMGNMVKTAEGECDKSVEAYACANWNEGISFQPNVFGKDYQKIINSNAENNSHTDAINLVQKIGEQVSVHEIIHTFGVGSEAHITSPKLNDFFEKELNLKVERINDTQFKYVVPDRKITDETYKNIYKGVKSQVIPKVNEVKDEQKK